ncbi:hypothetical protein O4G98_16100 [Zoogloeaceae bacterium G21618-S1]|jgi:hypothetical protein|nr:hypothetical protein [Zoogloeaceae bacterium G21618-S1]
MKRPPSQRSGIWLALAMTAVALLAARAWTSPDLLLAMLSLDVLCR